jgi:succinate-acetate transporter protein
METKKNNIGKIITKENNDKKEKESYLKEERIQRTEFSESIKLKELNSKNENNEIKNTNNLNKNQPLGDKSDKIPEEFTKNESITESKNVKEDKQLNIYKELEYTILRTKIVNKYGNSIPLGAFCNAMAFICFGLYKCRLLSDENTNVWSIMVLFGGLGQITAGFMELTKGREFPTYLYLIYGIYCSTHYSLRVVVDRFGEYDLCIFFMGFFILSIPLIIYSVRINLIYLLQTISVSLYFLSVSVGEAINEYILIEQVGGSFQILSGFLSFYIFFSQCVNSTFYYNLRTFPFDENNKIDFIIPNKKPHKS